MRQIKYNDSSFTIRFEYPPSWAEVASVTLTINDTGGTELLAATAATVWTTTATAAAVSVGDAYVEISTPTDKPQPGDRYRIPGASVAAGGPPEIFTLYRWDSDNSYMYAEKEFRHPHPASANITAQWCTYALDTSTVATWTKGRQLVLIWTPNNDAFPVYERAEIAISDYSAADFESRFEILCPREHQVVKANNKDIGEYYTEAREQLRIALRSRGMFLERVVDQTIVMPVLMAFTRYLVTLQGGERWEAQREAAQAEYVRLFEELTNNPIWIDMDQDQARDDDEIDDYSARQQLGSERAI